MSPAAKGAGPSAPAVRTPPRFEIGTIADGRALTYCEAYFEFAADGEPVSLSEVRELDRAGCVRWRFLEQRDWMRRLDDAAFQEAYERALEGRTVYYGDSALDEQIRRHVKRDNSYLHGHIVDTDQEEAMAEAARQAAAAQAETDAQAEEGGAPSPPPDKRARADDAETLAGRRGPRKRTKRLANAESGERPGVAARFRKKRSKGKGVAE